MLQVTVTIALLVALHATATGAAAQDWPQWRGASLNGVASVSSAPVRWTATNGVAWKTALSGHGTSSPVVARNLVFVTAQEGAGPIDQRGAQFPGTQPAMLRPVTNDEVILIVQALHLANGQTAWEHRFVAEGPIPAVHRNHNLATPSVATDGTYVVAWFGTGQLVILDFNGNVVWKRHLGHDYSTFDVLWGHGSSPALYQDFVILLIDHPSDSRLIALDKQTGHERWLVHRGSGLRSYSTPVVVKHEGRDELIVNSSQRIEGLDPQTGALLWYTGAPVELAIGVPVHDDGILFTSRGYSSSPYLAVSLGGQGDVSETHVRWQHPTGAPYISSLLVHEGLLYMATEHGILTVTETESGEVVWRERLGGVFTASPVLANGHLYFLNESGDTVVLKPGRLPNIVARNPLNERTLASPAVVDGRILIRTEQNLICIEEQNSGGTL